jgi:hypothetical protein
MGDAKRRGIFEERKAGAIAKQKVKAEREVIRRAEIEASKTPEQKLKEHHAMMEIMTLLGMAGAYGLPTLKRGKR